MPGTSAQEAAVREVVADAGRCQSDPDRFLPLHAPDVEIVKFGGRRVVGREALEAAMRAALASPMADVTTAVEITGFRFPRRGHGGPLPREGVAVVAAVKRARDARGVAAEGGPALPAASGQLTCLLVEEADGVWRVSLAQTTPTAF
ncbi:YybH family protein [Streptomyces sp. NPDC058373]|uniref:YybH family protein n=1 Tax=Streptomyces sp. NPDC058373 TaxID=3346465 RepID=UPI003647076C